MSWMNEPRISVTEEEAIDPGDHFFTEMIHNGYTFTEQALADPILAEDYLGPDWRMEVAQMIVDEHEAAVQTEAKPPPMENRSVFANHYGAMVAGPEQFDVEAARLAAKLAAFRLARDLDAKETKVDSMAEASRNVVRLKQRWERTIERRLQRFWERRRRVLLEKVRSAGFRKGTPQWDPPGKTPLSSEDVLGDRLLARQTREHMGLRTATPDEMLAMYAKVLTEGGLDPAEVQARVDIFAAELAEP